MHTNLISYDSVQRGLQHRLGCRGNHGKEKGVKAFRMRREKV
jgi:hypothetical protein